MNLINNILSIVAGFLMVFSGLPQILKMVKTEKSDDISLKTYLITSLSVMIMTYLSIVENSVNLCCVNIISLVIMGITCYMIIYYRKVSNG